MEYAISIAGFKQDLITKPFLAMPTKLDFFVMLVTDHEKSQETSKKVEEFLDFVNVRTLKKKINDIYNFYEIYIALEAIKKEFGTPTWVNVTPGPGIAIASLTFFAINNNVPVIFYNSENQTSTKVDVHDSKKIFIYIKRGIKILETLRNGEKSLQELAQELKVSKSTISRKVSDLKTISIVNTRIESRKVIVSLAQTGLQLLGK